jgi:hypothetical protein
MGMAIGTPEEPKIISRGYRVRGGFMEITPNSWPKDGFINHESWYNDPFYDEKSIVLGVQFWRLFLNVEFLTVYEKSTNRRTDVRR